MSVHNKDLRRLWGCASARLSAISEPLKSRSIKINDPGRLGNEGEARTVLKGDWMTLSSGVYRDSSFRVIHR
jgi:hypothetical protein